MLGVHETDSDHLVSTKTQRPTKLQLWLAEGSSLSTTVKPTLYYIEGPFVAFILLL